MNKFYKFIFSLFFYVLIFLSNFNILFAQEIDNKDKDLFENIKESLTIKPKFYISFDNKNSFISNRSGWFLGAKIGLEHNKIFRYGLGFNGLYNKTYSTYVNGIKESEEYLSFNYISFFAEYIFKTNKRYEFSLPINFGLGYSWLGDLKTTTTGQFQILYETQLNGMYFPIKFFGIGAGVGYRIMLKNNSYIDEQFTAPIYSIKAKIVLGELN